MKGYYFQIFPDRNLSIIITLFNDLTELPGAIIDQRDWHGEKFTERWNGGASSGVELATTGLNLGSPLFVQRPNHSATSIGD